jgi:ATP/ADP translocase
MKKYTGKHRNRRLPAKVLDKGVRFGHFDSGKEMLLMTWEAHIRRYVEGA